MKVEGRGGIRIVKIPVIQFIWMKNTYEIADKTSYIHRDYKMGDEVIGYLNPQKNENIAIIKRGFGVWFGWFIIAIGAILL